MFYTDMITWGKHELTIKDFQHLCSTDWFSKTASSQVNTYLQALSKLNNNIPEMFALDRPLTLDSEQALWIRAEVA